MVSIVNILSGAMRLMVDVRQTGGGPAFLGLDGERRGQVEYLPHPKCPKKRPPPPSGTLQSIDRLGNRRPNATALDTWPVVGLRLPPYTCLSWSSCSFVPNSPRRSSCSPCAACFPVHIGESSVLHLAPCRPGYAGSLPNVGRTPPVTRAVHPQHSGHLVNRFGWSSALDSPRRQPPDQLLLEGQ
jgi:hypothetical protein